MLQLYHKISPGSTGFPKMPQTGAICIMKIKRKASVSFYITEALLALLKEKDYQDISITELCEKADVTRTSFYRNFKSKDDILFKRVRAVTNAFLEESKNAVESLDIKKRESRFLHLSRFRFVSLCYNSSLV